MRTIHGGRNDSPEAVTLIDAHHRLPNATGFFWKNAKAFYRL